MPNRRYSDLEYHRMVECYRDAGQIATRARALYIARGYVQEDRTPGPDTIVQAQQRLRDWGTFRAPNADLGRPTIFTDDDRNAVVRFFEQNPWSSVRDASRDLDLNTKYVWQVLQAEQLYPYHLRKVQHMLPPDLPARIIFCQWLLEDRNRNILWTDESTFTRGGYFNTHNEHIYARENPHAMKVTTYQHRFSRNVWAGILNGNLLGPIFMNRLNGREYLEFLANNLEDMLDDIPLADTRSLFYQQDGAPAHYWRSVRDYLTMRFGARWIGRGGPVAWPPRSPDLTPLDFFLWGRVKDLVYAKRPEIRSGEELETRIIAAFDVIRRNASELRRVRLHTYSAAACCVERGGGHVEPFLQ